ncbi:MAG: branched-chain amino acid aminotransferase [Flavobacteriales bacterium]|nr:branched-chain amino acid aminotransferase [Flavobacteriales bacterium]
MVDVVNINVEKVNQSRIKEVDFDKIVFGKVFSDHMFVADYKNGEWSDLKIQPYSPISLSPACAALHYGQAIFEGMKAYKNENGEVLLFRPYDNAKRINISARRMCMPEIPEEIFIEGLKKLISLDSAWIPSGEDSSLYIRPFMFASEQLLGVRPADEYKFIIFTAPVNSYYSVPVNVKVETEFSRAMEGGVGFAKVAGNYGAALYPAKMGQDKGYQQLVWTDSATHEYIEESGTMNVMFQIGNKLITPNLDLKTTLAGITRDSVLTIAKELEYEVEERRVSVKEIIESAKNGSLKDVFGTGTAATIAQIVSITLKGERFELPPIENRAISNSISKKLMDIKKGRVEDKYGWVLKL